MNTIEKLTEYFAEFPGIGPRQAKRFVYYLLTRNVSYIGDFVKLVNELKKEIRVCHSCFRFFQSDIPNRDLCDICGNTGRENDVVTIVSRDVDLENIERARIFHGVYFILGGSVPILEKDPEKRIRAKELKVFIENKIKKDRLKEIIIALNATPEGENTSDYVETLLKDLVTKNNIKVSHLGRGISTGTELEYSDPETIKNALDNRK